VANGRVVGEDHLSKSKRRIQRQFDQIETALPGWAARMLAWLRRPSAMLIRIPLGFLLVLGGIFSFLPVLGIWMLPLGLMLLAIDIPLLQGPVSKAIIWGKRKWQNWKRKREARKRS
jgi:membrane-bound ClpP family serine protease